MRIRRLRGRRLQGVPFADRRPRGLVPRAVRLIRRCRVPARHLPSVIALPLAAATLAPSHDGRDPFTGQEAGGRVGLEAGGPFAGREPLVPPPAQEPQAPPREVHPEAREAIAKIRSPFCPGQMLEVCPSSDAAVLRDSLDQMAARGLPADSMVELVVKAYGEEYRALPKRSGAGLLAWVMPPAALIVGLGLVVLALRRLKGPGPGRDGEALTDEDRDRLDAALAELEEMEENE